MRTIAEIKKTMTDAIMSDATLVERLGLDTTAGWDEQVSSVSVLNLLLYVVAVGQHATEWMLDQFKAHVEERIAAAYPGSVSWLWNRALEYQDNAAANAYFNEHGRYETANAAATVVRYAAVVEKYNTVTVKVSGEGHRPLTPSQLAGFAAYMDSVKFAGVHVSASSIQSDDLALTLRVWLNRLVMPDERAADEAIESAVKEYLDNIRYGGVFNKTRLVDALQAVAGIDDIVIEGCAFDAHDGGQTHTDLDGQNYEAIAGHINILSIATTYE